MNVRYSVYKIYPFISYNWEWGGKSGEPLWLSGKVVKNEEINEIERTRVHSPPRSIISLKK
jgi:hypothetical protein